MTRTQKIVTGVVIAVLVCLLAAGGFLFGAALIGWRAATRAGNEAATVQNLRTIGAVEIQYYNTHGRRFGTFEDLIREELLSDKFKGEAPVTDGYVLKLTVTSATANANASYSVTADPQDDNTGRNHFYFDSSLEEIRINPNHRAGPNDPPLNK
jgi:hypothetical protein